MNSSGNSSSKPMVKPIYGDPTMRHHNGTGDVKDTNIEVLRLQIRGILVDRRRASVEELRKRYFYTALNFPTLFDEAYKTRDTGSFLEKLEKMLVLIAGVQHKHLSQRQASEAIGNELAEEYVFTPGVAPRPTDEDKDEARKRLNND